MLETALNEGKAVGNNVPATGETQEDAQASELTVEQLSNAATLASAILASHGPPEVTKAAKILHLLVFQTCSHVDTLTLVQTLFTVMLIIL